MSARSLWPRSTKAPYRRLVISLIAAPLIATSILTGAAFGLAGMSEPDLSSVLSVTLQSGIAILTLVLGFTLTFGLLGLAALWFLGQRGFLAWCVAGVLGGAIFGILFGNVMMGEVQRPLFLIFAITGAVVMLLIRLIAGVQDEPDTL